MNILCLGLAACANPPNTSTPNAPVPSATATTTARAPHGVGTNGACERDDDCATGLACTCLGVGAKPPCGPTGPCESSACGQRLCVDPRFPPPPPPAPAR